ncbi:MAG: class I SAM-dependent methyltransferase [Planctomycetota bacterium]
MRDLPSKSTDPTLLDQLRAPGTSELLHAGNDGNTIETASGCEIGRVIGGIPRFVNDQHLGSFGHQWTTFEVAHDEEDRATFEAKTGVQLSDLKGLRVLDAGCGGGRYSKVCGAAGAIVIGADHTRAVEKASLLCSDLPNVQFIQADLKQLPLEPGSFDFVFSIGVMHHDVATRSVFDAVSRMVRPGGLYSVWLYRRNQWWQELINSGLRAVTTRMPTNLLIPFCHIGAILGSVPILNRTLNKIVNFSAHPWYQNRVCDTFDWWAPQYQHHHSVAELCEWFESAGFIDLRVLPPEKSGQLYLAAYEANLLIGSGVNVTGRKKSE